MQIDAKIYKKQLFITKKIRGEEIDQLKDRNIKNQSKLL